VSYHNNHVLTLLQHIF